MGEELAKLEKDLQTLLYTIPNVPNENVPAGFTDEDNEVIFEHGQTPVLSEGALPHWELIKKYDIVDFELGVKISGAGFPVYKGKGARLQRAMINYFLDEAIKEGFAEEIARLEAERGVSYEYDEDDAEAVKQIKELIDTYVKPAVEMDGGNIEFKSFHEGIVTVIMQGSCSGCPSSTVTLKSGIESMLKRMMPQVKEVVQEMG